MASLLKGTAFVTGAASGKLSLNLATDDGNDWFGGRAVIAETNPQVLVSTQRTVLPGMVSNDSQL